MGVRITEEQYRRGLEKNRLEAQKQNLKENESDIFRQMQDALNQYKANNLVAKQNPRAQNQQEATEARQMKAVRDKINASNARINAAKKAAARY
jgi:negative regulator of replication initiation